MRYYPDTDYLDRVEPLDVAQFELDREQAELDAEADRYEYLSQYDDWYKPGGPEDDRLEYRRAKLAERRERLCRTLPLPLEAQ